MTKSKEGVVEYALDDTARTNDISAIGDSKFSSGLGPSKKKIL